MKYHLVALFDDNSNLSFQKLYQHINRTNKNSFSTYYINLESLFDEIDINKITHVIEKNIKPYKKFKVMVEGKLNFNGSNRSLNIKVKNQGYIETLSRNLSTDFQLCGFNTKTGSDNKRNLYISLGYINANKSKNLDKIDLSSFSLKAKLIGLQLIDATIPKKKNIINTFYFREY